MRRRVNPQHRRAQENKVKKMLLAVDIGNTNINLGLFKGNTLIKRFSIATQVKDYRPCLKRIFGRSRIDDAIISSVVPSAARKIEKDLDCLLGKKPLITGRDIKVPVKNLYTRPGQVGQDRLVNAYAGIVIYQPPLVLVDFGTAITFDAVSKNKEYLGGMILPGLAISLEVLNQKTALLPRIKLERPRQFIGRDTKNSILSGIIYGFASLADDLVKRIKNKIGRNAKVIGTGGNIGLIGRYCKNIDRINKDLTLLGLNFIYKQWKSR